MHQYLPTMLNAHTQWRSAFARAPSAITDSIPNFSLGMGGFKQSGLGREGGEVGLHAYLESKAILLDAELPRS